MMVKLFFLITQPLLLPHCFFIIVLAREYRKGSSSRRYHHLLGDMVFRVVPYIFLLHLLLYSASSIAEDPPLNGLRKYIASSNLDDPMLFSSSQSISQLDTVPIVNPTFPGTSPPVDPTISPPSPTLFIPPPPATYTAPATATPVSGAWCIASSTASSTALQVALDYACGYGGADCSAIQPGGSCYNPNTIKDHASYAFNAYYIKNPAPTSCVFGGVAQLSYTDPSSGNCHYSSSTTTTSMTPPVNTTPTTPPPPAITTPTTTPPTITTPTISTPTTTIYSPPYGVAEPTSLPSSATSMSCSTLLVFSAIYGFGSLLA